MTDETKEFCLEWICRVDKCPKHQIEFEFDLDEEKDILRKFCPMCEENI